MNILSYYQRLNSKSQEIFLASTENVELLTKVHNSANDFNVLAKCISNSDEMEMVGLVCTQLESSCLALTLGLYRPALTSLRLAFEYGMGALFFSANKLAHKEWKNGAKEADLKWSLINSEDGGVLSTRFVSAFFPELTTFSSDYRERAKVSYRCLSEYVHGNNDTWKVSGLVLNRNKKMEILYREQFEEIVEILKFAFLCRYLLEINKDKIDDIEPIFNEKFMHIETIRTFFGGPKDIK